MSARDELEALIKRLEEAREGSMGLSREVARAVGWVNRGNSRNGEWFHPDDTAEGKPVLDSLHGTDVHREPPDFTRSVDAALSLVPEGEGWNLIRFDGGDGRSQAHIGDEIGDGNTPAAALCIACLRCRLAELKDEQK